MCKAREGRVPVGTTAGRHRKTGEAHGQVAAGSCRALSINLNHVIPDRRSTGGDRTPDVVDFGFRGGIRRSFRSLVKVPSQIFLIPQQKTIREVSPLTDHLAFAFEAVKSSPQMTSLGQSEAKVFGDRLITPAPHPGGIHVPVSQ